MRSRVVSLLSLSLPKKKPVAQAFFRKSFFISKTVFIFADLHNTISSPFPPHLMENINDFDSVRNEQKAIQNSTPSEGTHTHTHTHRIFRIFRKQITLTQASMPRKKKPQKIAV